MNIKVMKKLGVFLSFFILFSCGNKTSVDIEEKRYIENKKEKLNVEEKKEELNVIDNNENTNNIEKILQEKEKEEIQVEEINKGVSSFMFKDIEENIDENGDVTYYSNKLNRNITSSDIFRNRYR